MIIQQGNTLTVTLKWSIFIVRPLIFSMSSCTVITARVPVWSTHWWLSEQTLRMLIFEVIWCTLCQYKTTVLGRFCITIDTKKAIRKKVPSELLACVASVPEVSPPVRCFFAFSAARKLGRAQKAKNALNLRKALHYRNASYEGYWIVCGIGQPLRWK